MELKEIDNAYYFTREIIRNNCDDKTDILIDKYETFCDSIDNAVNEDVIRENLTFDYDSILDINDENKYVMFESNLFRRYLETLNNVHKYYIKCNQINELKKTNTKIINDIIDHVIFKCL